MTNHKVATGLIGWYLKKYNYKAITMPWNTVYYIDEDRLHNKCLREHELVHIKQMNDEGKFMFLVKYFYYNITIGYDKNPFELEAYAVQYRCAKSS